MIAYFPTHRARNGPVCCTTRVTPTQPPSCWSSAALRAARLPRSATATTVRSHVCMHVISHTATPRHFVLGAPQLGLVTLPHTVVALITRITGLSLTFAVYVSASVSGGMTTHNACIFYHLYTGHLNPAVTLAMCVHRRFEWRFLPGTRRPHACIHIHVLHAAGYAAAQLCGAFTAAALVYGVYFDAIQAFDDQARPHACIPRQVTWHQHPNATVSSPDSSSGIFVPWPVQQVSIEGAFFDQGLHAFSRCRTCSPPPQ